MKLKGTITARRAVLFFVTGFLAVARVLIRTTAAGRAIRAAGHFSSIAGKLNSLQELSLIHISEPTRPRLVSRMPSSA